MTGLLLLNLGTPKAPKPDSVRAYLKEFLMDPYVVDLAYPLRWFLVHVMILPKRSHTSAEAYQKVWTKRGSPLAVYLDDLTEKVQKLLPTWKVKQAMRYQEPSLHKAIEGLIREKISELVVFPLYPQYSLAATESSIQEVKKMLKRLAPQLPVRFIEPFYNHPLWVDAVASVSKKELDKISYDHVLMSFHGIPERQIKKTPGCSKDICLKEGCCESLNQGNANCYRAQCFESARQIAQRLGMKPEDYSVCFQSRLGVTPWIKPFTDHLYESLPKKGVKKLAVMCPSFVADCLETLEEVQMRGKEQFVKAGGEELTLIPSLNNDDIWAEAAAKMVEISENR